MATMHGSAAKLYVAGVDLTSFMREGSAAFSVDTADVTTWGSTAKQYIPGRVDATFSGGGIYDADMVGGGKSDDVLSPILGAAAPLVHLPQGDTLGAPCFIVDSVGTSYEVTSPGDDVSSFSFEAQSNSGNARGVVLRPIAGALTINAAGNGTSVDDQSYLTVPAATTFGGWGILQCLNKGGGAGTLTVTVQSSTNGSTGWADIGTFTAISALRTSQVIWVAPGVTINRYLRAAWTMTGTGTWDIFVGFARRQS